MPCKFGSHTYLKIPYCQQLMSPGKRSHSCFTDTCFFAGFKKQKLVNMSKFVCCGSQLTNDLPDNKPGQPVLVSVASTKIGFLSWFSSQVNRAGDMRQGWCCLKLAGAEQRGGIFDTVFGFPPHSPGTASLCRAMCYCLVASSASCDQVHYSQKKELFMSLLCIQHGLWPIFIERIYSEAK